MIQLCTTVPLQQQISEIRSHRECERLYKRAKSTERICLSMGCTCMENGMPLACKTGNKLSHEYVLSGIKLADGRIVSRRRTTHSDNCGRVPRLFVPIAPYLDWIHETINGPKTTKTPGIIIFHLRVALHEMCSQKQTIIK